MGGFPQWKHLFIMIIRLPSKKGNCRFRKVDWSNRNLNENINLQIFEDCHLQVSLSRMILDIFKFCCLYLLVLFAFSCGKIIIISLHVIFIVINLFISFNILLLFAFSCIISHRHQSYKWKDKLNNLLVTEIVRFSAF